jgi:CBS domain containing-hemolysin-like protein
MISSVFIILLSLLFSAFFSGMETAFVASNKMQLEIEKKKDTFLAGILTKITRNPSRFITSMLVGNTISLVVYSFFMGNLILEFIKPFFDHYFPILLIQTLITTLIILITGEFLPKLVFRSFSNETLKIFAIPTYLFYLLLYVISDFIMSISNFILKVFFHIKQDEVQLAFSKVELENYISEQIESARDEIDAEIQIFQNALDFHKVRAREAMIPRTEIVAIELHESISALKQLFVETGLTRILVYNNSFDDIVGYVHTFDMFHKPRSIRSVVMPLEMVPESMMIHDVLNDLIKKQKSIAIVLDEYGVTSGLITVEDIVEELFGDIEDEHDTSIFLEEKISDTEYKFSTRLEVDYLNETYDLNLKEDNTYDTLGGLIMHHTEDIPDQDEVIDIGDFQFKILKVSASKIEEVHLKILHHES